MKPNSTRKTTKYWFFNTNSGYEGDRPNPDIWFEHNVGISGAAEYGPPLRKLSEEDVVFMYESGVGIVGVGRVLDPWDGRAYWDDENLLYKDVDFEEFRVSIDWCHDLREKPRNGNEVVGNTPAQFLEQISDPELLKNAKKFVKSLDRVPSDPDRTYNEGGRGSGRMVYKVHRHSQLAKDKLASIPREDLACECCEIRTQDQYPFEFHVYEVHHRKPFEDDDTPRVTKLKDVAILCPNCHVAVTKTKLKIGRLKEIVKRVKGN